MKEKLIDNVVLAETVLTELKGRLLQLANTLGQTDLGTFAYGYDNPLLGQRTSMRSALGVTNYSYDSNYQLTGATYPNAAPFNGEVHAWTYDNIGNRLTNTVNASTANYTYFKNSSNPLNGQRLQNDGTKTYTYDANGNVTGDGTHTYTWDYENRMTGITGAGLTASYSYDYEGRRKSKTVNGVTTTYLYDGQSLIRETSATNDDYLFGPQQIDEPIAQNRAGTISYYLVDALGSTTGLDDLAGTIQNAYTYDAWGVIRNQTGSTPNPFGYTSREFAEAGLYFYRARYFQPSTGRFISEDPIAFEGGLNFYAYVRNSPILLTDPLGLKNGPAPWEPPTPPTKPDNSWKSKCRNSKPLKPTDPGACQYGPNSKVDFGVIEWNLDCVCKSMGDNPNSNCVRGCIQCAKDNRAPVTTLDPHIWCRRQCADKGSWTHDDNERLNEVIYQTCSKCWFQF